MNVSISTLFRIVRSLAPEGVVLWDSAFCQNSVWMNFFLVGVGEWQNEQEYRNGGVVTQHAIVEGFFFNSLFQAKRGEAVKGTLSPVWDTMVEILVGDFTQVCYRKNRYYRYSIVDNEAYPGHLSWRRWLIFSRSGLPAMFSRKRNDLAQYFNHKINPLTTWFFSQTRWLDIGVLCILW